MARRMLVITSKWTLKFLIKTFLSQIVDEYFKPTIGFSKNFFVNLHFNYCFCRFLRVSRRFLTIAVQFGLFSFKRSCARLFGQWTSEVYVRHGHN